MPELVSKLQYKTCEVGEYYDEKARNLEETLDLIKAFPWAREQYADVDLTGPSVTIKGEDGSYLKVGIYYGGKFSLYFLDKRNRLYEYHQIYIENIYEKVSKYFGGSLNLRDFEKQDWRIGVRTMFRTKQLEYKIKWWRIGLMIFHWWIFLVMFLGFFVGMVVSKPVAWDFMLLFPALLISYPLLYVSNKFHKARHQYLKISRGSDVFLFGNEIHQIKSYNKNDINKIVEYINKNARSNNPFEVYDIIFNDGSSIRFSNALISSYNLSFKFSDKWKIPIDTIKTRSYRILPLLA